MIQSISGTKPNPFQQFDIEFGRPIEGLSAKTKLDGLVPLDGMAGGTDPVGGPTFGAVLHDALKSVEAEKAKAEALTLDFATGKPVDIHQMMIQVAKADVEMQVTSAVVSKSATALSQLLQIQV